MTALETVSERVHLSLVAINSEGTFASAPGGRLTITDIQASGIELLEDGDTRANKGATCTVTVTTPVEQDCCNISGNAHGGFLAWLLDVASSLPLMALSSPDAWITSGVSTQINIHYISAAPLGTKLKIVSSVLQQSKNLAVMDCKITEDGTGRLIATGTHVKAESRVKPSRFKL